MDNRPAKDHNCLRHGGYPGSTQVANITPANISPAVVKDSFEKPVLTNPPMDNGWSIKTSSSNIPINGNDILPSNISGDLGIIQLDKGEATTLTTACCSDTMVHCCKEELLC